ncbi:MAG: hypothetical protein CM1200mP34_3310 [Verrucomicrobiales bacterium]|nr:MAG: hypothetical protein CM1200mP34_3310 [Verrucomicrobiales bacterium]
MMGRAFLRRGYSLFAVSHLSQPKATIPEIYDDVTRAVQHIREHAGEYGVDPGPKLGVVGASAGGHLSLMVATRGKETPGKQDGLVRAVAIFFPVTDVLKPGNPAKTEKDGGPSKRFRKLFGIDPDDLDAWNRVGRELSPLHHVDADTPPVLIIHGDDDEGVSFQQSEWYIEAAEKHGATAKLIRKRGKGQAGQPSFGTSGSSQSGSTNTSSRPPPINLRPVWPRRNLQRARLCGTQPGRVFARFPRFGPNRGVCQWH